MNQHKNNSHYLINMSSELLNALIYEHPIVNSLQKKIKKLEKKNMKLNFKKKNWKKKIQCYFGDSARLSKYLI